MISLVQVIASGNALRLLLQPPAGSLKWRVLRKDTDTFTDVNDAGAFLVYDGTERSFLDVAGLYNGQKVYYRAYYWNGSVWLASASAFGTPEATFSDLSADPLTIVRNRLDLGLQVYVDRNKIAAPSGAVKVMTASPLAEEISWPVVTIHVASDASAERFIGELVANDTFDPVGNQWDEYEGWFSRVQLTIVAWCLNADERIVLRQAMKAVLMSNLTVFDAAGLMQIDLQFSDQEDFTSYAAPIYQALCNFTCYAPSVVEGTDPAIRDVISTLIV